MPSLTDRRRPLFLFSLPRSGSTLLQRVLAGHSEITTTAEPWILLSILHAGRDAGIYTKYDQVLAARAVNDFTRSLGGGQRDFDAAVREFAMRLYSAVPGPPGGYFLDKTPRYHLVADDILRAIPDAKAILLWRNPLAVVASFMDTFAAGRWNLHVPKVDLFEGLERLVELQRTQAARLCVVRYEDLVRDPVPSVRRICGYLGIAYSHELVSGFVDVLLPGVGDPTGAQRYRSVSAEPVDKWRTSLANPIRKTWARRYLRWIGQERLALMGYDVGELLGRLDAMPLSFRHLGSDAVRLAYGSARAVVEPRPFRDKLRALPRWTHVYNHP